MKIVIAGAGEVGTHLAKMLSQENQDIILMDPNEERLNFSKSSMEILPMVGNPTSLRDLEEAGIKKADLFVSVTPEETTNVTACMLAHNLGAHRTLARINNYEYLLPKNKELFEKQRSMLISVARQHKRTSSTRLMVKTASRLRMILRLSGMRAQLMRRNYNVSLHRNGLRTSRCLARLGRNFVVQVIRNYSRTA